MITIHLFDLDLTPRRSCFRRSCPGAPRKKRKHVHFAESDADLTDVYPLRYGKTDKSLKVSLTRALHKGFARTKSLEDLTRRQLERVAKRHGVRSWQRASEDLCEELYEVATDMIHGR